MSRILQSTDWSFLVGGEVIQLCIGFNDIQIHLFKSRDIEGPSFSINCEFEHRRAGELLSDQEQAHLRATTLVSLLGKRVDKAWPDGEVALTISFANRETLKIIVDDSPYEAFNVKGPQGLIVV